MPSNVGLLILGREAEERGQGKIRPCECSSSTGAPPALIKTQLLEICFSSVWNFELTSSYVPCVLLHRERGFGCPSEPTDIHGSSVKHLLCQYLHTGFSA